ncbi:hypothetical protein H5410_061887, partial [Solanum commersonii]
VQPPHGDDTNVEFRNAIKILTQVVTTQVGRYGVGCQDEIDMPRVQEFLRMNLPESLGQSSMRIQKTLWFTFKRILLGHIFAQEIREAKVRELLNLNQESMSMQVYNLKFTQLSRYAPEIVADMRSRVEENKFKDREEFRNKRAKTTNYELSSRRPRIEIVHPSNKAMRFGISPKQLLDPFRISAHIGESILGSFDVVLELFGMRLEILRLPVHPPLTSGVLRLSTLGRRAALVDTSLETGESSKVTTIKAEVTDLRKDVYYLKSVYFTSLLEAIDDVDALETSVIPSYSTGIVHRDGIIVDESEAETDEEKIETSLIETSMAAPSGFGSVDVTLSTETLVQSTTPSTNALTDGATA